MREHDKVIDIKSIHILFKVRYKYILWH